MYKIDERINELKIEIEEIENQEKSYSNKKDKTQLRKRISVLCMDGVRYYSNHIRDPRKRKEAFDKVHTYFFAGYKHHYFEEDWESMFECYKDFLEGEVNGMFELKHENDVSGEKRYGDIFVRTEIDVVFRHCKEAIKHSDRYNEFEGLKSTFIQLYRKIQILYAESFYEKEEYRKAIDKYSEIYVSYKNCEDARFLSDLLRRKGQVYHSCSMPRQAIQVYEEAISLLKQSDSSPTGEIGFIEEQRSKAYAMLEQQMAKA